MSGHNRHVLFIIADDWSPIARCYGDHVVQTPHIDAFAQRSTVFTHAFCTSPSCAASRASILTGHHTHTHGQYGHCHGANGFSTHPWMPTLPAVLGNAGIRCQLIGKNHTAPAERYPWVDARWPPLPTPAGFANALADACKQPEPSFIMVAPNWPHREDDDTGFGLHKHTEAFHEVTYDPATIPVPAFLPEHPDVSQDLAYYYAAVSRFDQCVGAALDALDASGRAEQTLVIVTSDHGMPFPGAKASSYDTGHRCPLIIRHPDQSGQVHCDALVNWLDLAPTLYDWFGVEPPVVREPIYKQELTLQGRSLLPCLGRAHPPGWDQTTFSHCFHAVTMYDPYRVLRTRRYKFIQQLAFEMPLILPCDLVAGRTWQAVCRDGLQQLGQRRRKDYIHRSPEALYDLAYDPLETTNLLDTSAGRAIAEPLRHQLIDLRRRTCDPWLLEDDRRASDHAAHPPRTTHPSNALNHLLTTPQSPAKPR